MSELAVTEPGSSATDAERLLALIRNRRSVGKVTDEKPDRDLIWTMLEAATWAPNHHLTEPWRFFVLEGAARERLGEVMGQVAARRETSAEARATAAERAVTKTLRAPYVIAVAVEPSGGVPEIEEIAAGSAAVQNLLLAAEALGLAAMWRSGWMCFEPEIREHFGLSEGARMLGFVYVGLPAMTPPTRVRRAVEDVTVWQDA